MLLSFNTGYSKCEQPAIPPLPAADCLRIWCGLNYAGCGAGNGTVCSTEKACSSISDPDPIG